MLNDEEGDRIAAQKQAVEVLMAVFVADADVFSLNEGRVAFGKSERRGSGRKFARRKTLVILEWRRGIFIRDLVGRI